MNDPKDVMPRAPDDGGPAFPGEKDRRFGQANDCNEGMTLRDYFAAKALEGYCVQRFLTNPAEPDGRGTPHGLRITIGCYEWADLMLRARSA